MAVLIVKVEDAAIWEITQSDFVEDEQHIS